jgi:peptidoglycan-associated lipoprotein
MKYFFIILLLGACSTSIFPDKNTKESPIVENRTENTTKKSSVVENETDKNNKTSVTKLENADIEIVKVPVEDKKNANKLFESYTIYFDLDEYIVQEKYQPLLKKHGEYLAKNPNEFLFIEGHTDERGGKEYNLSLGQKRANAVKVELKKYGVLDSQMEAYSYGSEKPKVPESNEEAWSQNRRVELYYKN